MSENDGGPAFPFTADGDYWINRDGEHKFGFQLMGGLTLRDYFAAHAMNAPWGEALTPEVYPDGVVTKEAAAALAASCYAVADAMLKERAK